MKKLCILTSVLFFINPLICRIDLKEVTLNQSINNDKKNKEVKKNKLFHRLRKTPKTILFNYYNEDITKVINELAALKRVNIIFPQPPVKLSGKVSLALGELTVNEAWNKLLTILNLAGYTLEQKGKFYQIVKNDIATREPLRLFVNNIKDLPNTDEKVQFIYFFDNISIIDTNNPSHANIEQILKDMLPLEHEGTTYILDNTTNALIVVGNSSAIKGVMRIIETLDVAGFPETIEVLPLMHTNADFISKIINQLLPGTQEPQFRYGPFPTKPKVGGYFSEQTKIIPLDRTNSVAILGFPDSVKRVKEFVERHLDQPIQSEKSIIHVKPLQFLDADVLAPVIQNLVKAKAAAAQAEAGAERDTLANSVIVAEKLVQAATIAPTGSPTQPAQAQTAAAPLTSTPLIGGNRVIVAARHQDWLAIRKLIDELDQPQLQVAIEVLVVDLLITDVHSLGSQIRNTLNGLQPSYTNFQAANIDKPWLNFTDNANIRSITPQGLAADLQRPTIENNIFNNGVTNLTNIPVRITSPATGIPGTTILTFRNGNGISIISQALQQYSSASILSQPFVISKNNQQANISITQERLVDGPADTASTGGPVIRKVIPLKADLTVNILPRISKSSEVNLEILVNVNDFLFATSSNVITTRQVRTNANLKNKEVLVLGGLARVDTNDEIAETPLLAQIPVLGYLFKDRAQQIDKRSLMIFISPTIIKPRLQGGIDTYTKDKIKYTKDEVSATEIDLLGTNFEKLREPITRVFFTPLGKQINTAIDYYASQLAYTTGSQKALVKGQIVAPEKSIENVETSTEEQEANKNNNENNVQPEEQVLDKAEQIKDMVKDDENPLGS